MLVTIGISILITLFYFVYFTYLFKNKSPVSEQDLNLINKEREKYRIDLEKQIRERLKTLAELNNQIAEQTIDHSYNLTSIELKALDEYERSNIKIPIEIIEDLHALHLQSESDIIDYIDNQRLFWKLENSKKLFKRKGSK